jgi:hypothetical protein
MFDDLFNWCNKNSMLCFLILLVILHQTGLLNELLRCLGLEGYAPYPESVDKPMDPNKAGEGISHPEVGAVPTQPAKKLPLQAVDLLPTDQAKAAQEFNIAKPIGEGILEDVNNLKAGYHIGIDTVGQTLRNANRQVRSEPANPQVPVSPWMNTTIASETMRRPLEIGEGAP